MDTQTIVLATRNAGKIKEMTSLLAKSRIIATGLNSWPEIGDIPETGQSFSENALIKARTITRLTGRIALADDSGLAVDALDGQPGIFSARYADDWAAHPHESRDARNIRKLLWSLRDVPPAKRGAHFETALAIVAPNGHELVTVGKWHGFITRTLTGSNGFGYDPVFFDPILKKNAAELDSAAKNAVSHRGRALQKMMEQLAAFMDKARLPAAAK